MCLLLLLLLLVVGGGGGGGGGGSEGNDLQNLPHYFIYTSWKHLLRSINIVT